MSQVWQISVLTMGSTFERERVRLEYLDEDKEVKEQLDSTRTDADVNRFLHLPQKGEQGINTGIFYSNDSYMCKGSEYAEMSENW